ncbi:hypothetical protein DL767_006984 [Monosporascus sp. MG133]|nr:hypothetical protein DL767_006984 [Monosporascus sp. MG133]
MTSNHSPGQDVHRKPRPQEPHLQLPALDFGHQPGNGTTSDSSTPSSAPAMQQQHGGKPSNGDAPSSVPTKLQKKPPVLSQPLPPRVPDKDPHMTPPAHAATFHFTETKPPPCLTMENPAHKRSSSSSQVGNNVANLSHPPTGLMPGQSSSSGEPRGRSSSAQPPSNRTAPSPGNIVVTTADSRPGSSNGSQSPSRDSEKRGRLRRSWLPGARSRSHSKDVSKVKRGAWILEQNQDYNTSFLTNGEKVPELWNENGTVYVYLHAKGTGVGPSFKVPSFVVDYSLVFAELVEAEMTSPTSSTRSRARSFTGRDNLSVLDAERRQVSSPPISPTSSDPLGSGESRLYLPVSMLDPGHVSTEDLERLISIRNMFAFLTGQPLVGTNSQPTLFRVLLNIATLLREFEFANADGSTFGEAVDMSFGFLMDQVALADVRHSREKTLESLILGERMRSMTLYNEAFAHAAGKYSAIRDLNSPLWEELSPNTRQRLERAHLDLITRQNSVNNRLEAFEFPALFSGVASSATMYKDVKFGVWRRAFSRMRQFALGYYKTNFGSWPPKARSKKNPFTESGLNRQVLKILYSDLCALYDLLADRESLTTRVIDQSAEEIAHDDENPHVSALRRILGEFDTSSPPVLPPIPFDLPKLPDMISVQENYYELSAKEQGRLDKSLQDYQLLLILNKAYDFETAKLASPFIEQFKEFEHKEAKGKHIAEVVDQRIGYWLFLYVVIQSLPMLVVDAPGLHFTEGVEYFLCQPAKGNPPWMGEGPSVRKRWYEVAGGGGLVELSEDAVEFSIEGIYHRSHCWQAAKQWEMSREGALAPAPQETLSPLQPPESVFTDMDPKRSASPPAGPPGLALRPRNGSPSDRSQAYRTSIALGLEPVALPQDGHLKPGSRVGSAGGPTPASRPVSALINRSRSSGNLHGRDSVDSSASQTNAQKDSRQSSVGGSTFDDILKDMKDADGKPKKKRTFF